MALPYRTRRGLRRLGKVILWAAVAFALFWGLWVLWAGRFVVYTREGATLDFSRSNSDLSGAPAVKPDRGQDVLIYYNEGNNAVNVSSSLEQFNGYYVSREVLREDPNAILQQVLTLPETTPVMLEMKDIYGAFYYETSIPGAQKHNSSGQITEMVKKLCQSHRYMIAKIPAFRDYNWGLNNTDIGIAHSSGGYLWMDDDGCYWLDPGRSGTLSLVVQIIEELKKLGFNEVVLGDFRIPTEGNIYYDDDPDAVLETAKNYIVSTCAVDDRFAVSFASESSSFTLPEGARSRLYLENVSATQVRKVAESLEWEDIEAKLVFITMLPDTRFDDYSVLRPITMLNN